MGHLVRKCLGLPQLWQTRCSPPLLIAAKAGGPWPRGRFLGWPRLAERSAVMIWAESLNIEHLLTSPPLGDVVDFEFHDAARRIILLSLSAADTDYTADTTYLYEAWNLLLDRHEPSRAVEVSEVYQKLTSAAQNGRPMGEHVQQCMTCHNRLKALGAELPHELFVQRLLEVDDQYMFMRASLVSMAPEQILAALLDQYRLFQQRKHQCQARSAAHERSAKARFLDSRVHTQIQQ